MTRIVLNVTNVMSGSTGAVLTIPLMKHHQICGIVQRVHIFDYMELCLNLKCVVNIGILLVQLGMFCRNNTIRVIILSDLFCILHHIIKLLI